MAGLLIAGALVFGQVVLVALAVPFVIVPVLGLAGRTDGTLTATATAETTRLREGDVVTVTVTLSAPLDLDAVSITVPADGLEPVGNSDAVLASVTAGTPTSVAIRYRAPRWGRHRIGPGVAVYHGAGLLLAARASVPAVTVDVVPAAASFSSGAAIPRARAYAGAHRSRAVGEGVEYAGMRPYASGDPLRRINWRATARTGDLTVTTTHTDRAADVVVVLDALYDVGPRGMSSVDIAVRAAFGIVEHYLRLGDSVGLLEYGGFQRVLAPGVGRAHLARSRDWLLDTRAVVTAAVRVVRWPAVFGSRTPLVVALTPLVDEASATLLARLRVQGAAVVGIDTLTPDALPRAANLRDVVATRLWRLERQATIARLTDLGVPVEPWGETGELDVQLERLTRVAAAPRMALR